MVKEGIPHSLRPYVWLRLAGAMQKKTSSEITYKQVHFTFIIIIRLQNRILAGGTCLH